MVSANLAAAPSAHPGPAAADVAGVSLMPEVHRLVTIADCEGREYCSRIEDVGEALLVLARPLTLPIEHEFEIGSQLFVSWPDPEGLTLATVRLVHTRVREHLGLWVTRVEELSRQQRRQFVRVPALGPIELAATGGAPGAAFAHVAGQLLDLSEAGLRCALAEADAEAVADAPAVLASFTLAGNRFTIQASVLRVMAARRDEQLSQCVLTFDIGEQEAAELRRRVFQEQLRARRRGGAALASLRASDSAGAPR